MTLILCGVVVLGRLAPFIGFAVEFYETFIKREPSGSDPESSSRATPLAAYDAPKLIVTRRLKDGTPIRAECPVCECEFSTEAFEADPTYPHEQRLESYYSEHVPYHVGDM